MRIGLDISQIVYQGTGVARYTAGLLEAILEYDTDNDWVFFFSSLRQKLPSKFIKAIRFKNHSLKQYPFPPTLLSLIWNRLHLLDIKYLTGKLDWYISSDWTEPPGKGINKATIIHDLAYLRYPETVDWRILKTQQQRLVHVCQETKLIISDSNSTKKDIEHFLTVKQAKIQTIYPGVKVTVPDKKTVRKALNKWRLEPHKFILSVGKLEPRKNLERLIKAYKQLPQHQYPLVIVGPKGWGSLTLSGQNIRVVGYLTDPELYSLYKSCLFFVYPSLYEGFGYPLIEAANFAAPMAVSGSSSLAELGKDISLQFNPQSVNDMSSKMGSLMTDSELRKTLGAKALAKAHEFSWQQTYVQIVNALKSL